MTLTPAQLATLKADILADAELSALPNNSDGNFEIARRYNLAASPAWVIWRTDVSRRDILQSDQFNWTRVDNLSVGKARIWSEIFVDGVINPSKANVRAGIEAVWVGTAADLAVREAVLAVCKIEATRVQKLFSTGVGNSASPATLQSNLTEAFEVSYQDVGAARDLP